MPNQELASAWIFGNSSVRVGTQGLFCPYLKTFVPPYPRVTAPGCPRMSLLLLWVSHNKQDMIRIGVFNFLTWTSQENSVDTTGKSALKLVIFPSFKVVHIKWAKIYLHKVVKIYRRLYGWWQVCASHNTNVCNILGLWGPISSLVFNKSFANLATLLIKKSSFQQIDGYSLTCPCQELKKLWKGILSPCHLAHELVRVYTQVVWNSHHTHRKKLLGTLFIV